MPHCLSVALPLSPALLVLVLTSSPFILQAISLSLPLSLMYLSVHLSPFLLIFFLLWPLLPISLDQTHPLPFSLNVGFLPPPPSSPEGSKGVRRKWWSRCGGCSDTCLGQLPFPSLLTNLCVWGRKTDVCDGIWKYLKTGSFLNLSTASFKNL